MKTFYPSKTSDSKKLPNQTNVGLVLSSLVHRIFGVLGLILISHNLLYAQNSLNSGDFSGGSWGSGQAMSASAGSSLIITKGVGSSGDKYFRFYGDGSPCGEYQPNSNGDFFTHDVVVTSPDANCGNSNAWRINVPNPTDNVVFKTDGANDGMDRSIAFVVQGPVETVTSVTRAPAGTVYPGLDVVVTANLSADFSTGQAAWLRYTNDGFGTSTVVKMTGSGTTRTATIPGATNSPSTAVEYYVFTSSDGSSISGADADFYTINLDNNGGSNYTYTTQAGWTANTTGSWGTAGTWTAAAVPPTNANMGLVTINQNVTLNQNAIVGSITIANARTLTGADASPRTLEVVTGGSITRAGTGNYVPSVNNTTIFQGTGSLTAAWVITWQHLQLSAALTTTGVQVINGSLQLNSTTAAISTAPTYGISSNLIYNSGGSSSLGNEWTSTATTGAVGAGRPNDVTIQGGTTLGMPAANRGLARDLTIANTGILNLNAGSGDLYLQRNWSNSGTFNSNNRAVGFTGTGNSTITNAAGETYDYLIITKVTSGNVVLNNNVTVAAASGNVLQFTGVTTNIGSIDLGGNTLTISGAGGNIFLGAGTALARNITGTGNFIVSGAKTVTRTTSNTLIFGTGVTVQLSTAFTLSAASISTVNGILQINFGGSVATNAPVYGGASALVYNSGGSYGISTEWTSTATVGAAAVGRPNDVTIQNGTTLDMTTTNRGLARDLSIDGTSILNLNGTSGDLYLQRNWSNSGSFNANGRAVGFTGTGNSIITNAAGESFDYLIITKVTSGNVVLNNDVTVAAASGNVLQFTGVTTNIGSIDLGGNTLTINGAGGNIFLGAGTALARNIIGTGNFVLSGAKTVTRTTSNTLIFAVGVTVQLSAALTLSAASISTINGTLQMNSGGSVVTNPPVYGAASMLIYNQGGSINTGTEWNITTGGAAAAGRPADVTIDNSTSLTLTASRGMARDLVVKTGSDLTLNAATGSIIVGRSWSREAGSTFNHNGRLTTLGVVNASSVIDVPGGEDFGALTLAKVAAATYVTMNNDVVVNGTFTMGANGGRFMIGSNTLTLNGNAATTASTGTISGTSNSNLIVNGTGATCTLAFTIAVAENQLGSLEINRTGPGTVNLASNLFIDNNSGSNDSDLTLTEGWLQVNTGFTLTVANTTIPGSTTGFVFTQTTGRLAYSITGAGSYNPSFPIGSAANVNSYRPISLNSVVQTADNTYTIGATVGSTTTVNSTYNAPLLGGSTVRYYPVNFGNIGVLTSIASVILTVGADDNPSGIDNQTIIQDFGGGWNDLGAVGGATKTSTSSPDLTSATSTLAFGFVTLSTVFVNQFTGSDTYSGQTSNNVPAGTGPKQTFGAAMTAVTNGGTVSYTGGSASAFVAQDWDIDKNVHLTQTGTAANCNLVNVTINVLNKAVMPFTASDVNTGTDRITITAHQLATGMAIRYNNFGEPFGFMPSGINTGTDVLTIGGNIATGQQVIYQAYPSAGEAGGLTHGTTYYAINVSATTIRLAATYADALTNTAVDITSTGSAESHGVIASLAEGLTDGATYYAIVIDANTIQLAATNPDALDGTSIDLISAGRGNHVLVFVPVLTGILSFKNPINITGVQALIDPFTTLVSTAGTINIGPGTFNMQPTIVLSKQLNLVGAGIGTTTISGGGKISSATSYFGIAYPTIALSACTLTNFTVSGYYIGINRNSTLANTSNVIEAVSASDNFNRGLNWEGIGVITTALTIRNSTFNNNNGVGVNSTGIYINGMTKVGLNIRNNTCVGNRNSGIEIGPAGLATNFFIKGNTIAGVNSVSPLQNSTTEFGIVVSDASPTSSNTHISDNEISMYGRAGIECRGCVGNGNVTGNLSFRIAGNYITQLGGPYRVEPNTSLQNDIRDIAGIAVGSMNGSALSSGVAIDTNQVEGIQQPNSITTAYTAFGIVSSGTNIVQRCNIITGCEIGMQAQDGASGNENNTPDNFYSKDNTATTTNYLANRNSITGNTVFGAQNQVGGTINFEGNWWGQQDGPTQANNTSVAGYPAGTGEALPTGTGIAYNAFMGIDPDENVGIASGQRGIQATSGKNFRLKPSANATSLAAPYVINQGINVGFGNNNSLYPDTLDIYPATYSLPTESIKILRSMYLRGNFGSGTQPIIQGTGNSVHPIELSGSNGRMLINIASRNSGVEYLNLKVSVPGFIFSPSMAFGIGDTILVATQPLAGVRIKNNLIQNTGSYNFTSYGIYFRSVNQSSEAHVFEISGNSVGTVGSGFGAPIRIWGGRGNVFGNTCTGAYPFRWGTVAIGGGTSNIYNNTFSGAVELNSPQVNSTTNVYNNTFNRNSATAHTHGIELRLNRQVLNAIVNIDSNTFNNIGQGGYPYWGVLSLRNTNINIRGNIFNAGSTATDFAFIHASTRQQGTTANPTETYNNTLVVKGNTFNGNAAASTNKVGISFARHRRSHKFGAITMGGIGADTNTFSGLSKYFELDTYTGPFSGIGLPYSVLAGTPDSSSVPMDTSFDASGNSYEVSTGVTKRPINMTLVQLFDLEDKIQHAIDYAALGFVTVRPKNKYVTTSSFLTGFTTTPLIGRALADKVIRDGDTVSIENNTYNETVLVDSSLTFVNDGTTVFQNLTMNGTGKTLTILNDFEVSNAGTLALTDGLIETGSNTLRVTNTATGGITGGSAASHVVGNLNRAINTGSNYDYFVGDGTNLEQLTLNFTNASLLTDVTVNYTTTAPGISLTNFNENGALFNQVLQQGYWIVNPNAGGTSTNYAMRLKPIGFPEYPFDAGIYAYTILKRVGAGNWMKDGTYDDPGFPNRIFGDGTIRRSGLSGFSNFGVGGSDNVPLPIRLGTFDAFKVGKDVSVKWRTLSETNVNHFEVQRSQDGISFEKIGSVSAKSEAGSEYQYVDTKPFDHVNNALYYRIRSVDYDLKSEFSPVRRLTDQLETRNMNIHPNPATTLLTINQLPKESVTITVYDQLGRKVISNAIPEKDNINISGLPAGIYRINIQTINGSQSIPFIKE